MEVHNSSNAKAGHLRTDIGTQRRENDQEHPNPWTESRIVPWMAKSWGLYGSHPRPKQRLRSEALRSAYGSASLPLKVSRRKVWMSTWRQALSSSDHSPHIGGTWTKLLPVMRRAALHAAACHHTLTKESLKLTIPYPLPIRTATSSPCSPRTAVSPRPKR